MKAAPARITSDDPRSGRLTGDFPPHGPSSRRASDPLPRCSERRRLASYGSMGNNAAFGRPRVGDEVRQWWDQMTPENRSNALIALVVGVIVVALVVLGTTRHHGKPASTGLAALAQPGSNPTSPFVPTTLTSAPPATIPGATSTSSPTTAPGSTTTAQPRTGAPTGATLPPASPTTTSAPGTAGGPVTTTPNPNVIFSDPPPTTPGPQPTLPTSTPTSTPTTTPPTTPSSTPPSTTPTTSPRSPTTTAPGGLPPLPDLPLLDALR